MQTVIRQVFLAAVLCTLAVPALARYTASSPGAGTVVAATGPQQTEGEAANLEKKETSVDAEVHPDTERKATAPSMHKNHIATTHPKVAAVQRTGTSQHSGAKLKTGQLTSGQSAKLQTKQTTMHPEVHQDREENGQQTAGEKAKVHQQDKTTNDIRLKKHNARMF